jgi:hypothetical protein
MDLIQSGRAALEKIASAVKDGSEAISAGDKVELQRILEREKAESQAAHDELAEAIRQARS